MPTVEQIRTLTVKAKQEGFDALNAALTRVSTAYGTVKVAADAVSSVTEKQISKTNDVSKAWEAFTRRTDAVARAAERARRDLDLLGKAAEKGDYLKTFGVDAAQHLEQDIQKALRPLDDIRAKYDEVFAAQRRHLDLVKEVTSAENLSILTAEKAAEVRLRSAETSAQEVAQLRVAAELRKASQVGPYQPTSTSTMSFGNSQEEAAYAAQINKIRAEYDKVFAAQQKYDEQLQKVVADHRVAGLSAESLAASIAELDAAHAKAISAIDGTAEAERKAAQAAAEAATQLANLKQEWNQFALANDETARAMEGFRRETDLIKRAFDQGLLGSGDAGLKEFNAQIDAAKQRLQDLSTASRGIDQTSINKTLNVGVNSGGADLAAEMEKDAANVKKLRAVLDPLSAKQAEVNERLGDYGRLLQKGQISTGDYAKLQAIASKELDNFERHLRKASTAGRVTSGELANLSFQVNDVITGLMLGQSPLMIFAQQGGQVFQIFQQSRASLGEFFTTSIVSFAKWLSVGKLAIGGIIGGFVGATAAAYQFSKAQSEANRATQGIGRASGANRYTINTIAEQAASPTGLSISEARTMATTFAASGRIAADSMLPLLKMGKDISRVYGVDVADAGKLMAEAFSDPASGVDKLNARFAAFDATIATNIKNLAAQGERQKALTLLASGLQSAIAGTNLEVGKATTFWTALGNKVSNYWDKVGEAASRATGLGWSPGPEKELKEAEDELKKWQDITKQWEPLVEERKKWGKSDSAIAVEFPEWARATAEVSRYTGEVKRLSQEMENLRQKQKAGADEAQRVISSQELDAAIRAMSPLIGQFESLDNTVGLTKKGLDEYHKKVEEASHLDDFGVQLNNINEKLKSQQTEIANTVAQLRLLSLQSQTKVGILGSAASPKEKLEASLDALRTQSKQIELAAQRAADTGTQGPTFAKTWEDRAASALKLGAALEQTGAKMSALGQAASVTDTVLARGLELDRLQMQGAGLTEKQIKDQIDLAREHALGTYQIKTQSDQLRIQSETIGMTVGESTKYIAVQTRIAEAMRNKQPLNAKEIEDLKKQAEALGLVAQAAQLKQLAYDVNFDRSQIGLSDAEQSANQKLRSMYKDLNSEGAQYWRQQLLVNDALKQYNDVSKDAAKGFISDIIAGKNALESLGNALTKIGNKLIEMAVDGLWSKAFGGSSGSGGVFNSVLNMVGLGGGGSGWSSAVSAGSYAIPKAGINFAGGGRVVGPGTSTSDSVPAMLSDGEFVVNAAATAKHLPLLKAINENASVPKYATGGLHEIDGAGKAGRSRRILIPGNADPELVYIGGQPASRSFMSAVPAAIGNAQARPLQSAGVRQGGSALPTAALGAVKASSLVGPGFNGALTSGPLSRVYGASEKVAEILRNASFVSSGARDGYGAQSRVLTSAPSLSRAIPIVQSGTNQFSDSVRTIYRDRYSIPSERIASIGIQNRAIAAAASVPSTLVFPALSRTISAGTDIPASVLRGGYAGRSAVAGGVGYDVGSVPSRVESGLISSVGSIASGNAGFVAPLGRNRQVVDLATGPASLTGSSSIGSVFRNLRSAPNSMVREAISGSGRVQTALRSQSRVQGAAVIVGAPGGNESAQRSAVASQRVLTGRIVAPIESGGVVGTMQDPHRGYSTGRTSDDSIRYARRVIDDGMPQSRPFVRGAPETGTLPRESTRRGSSSNRYSELSDVLSVPSAQVLLKSIAGGAGGQQAPAIVQLLRSAAGSAVIAATNVNQSDTPGSAERIGNVSPSPRDVIVIDSGGVVRLVRQGQDGATAQVVADNRVYPAQSGGRDEIVVGNRVISRRRDDSLVHPAYFDDAPVNVRNSVVTNNRISSVYRDAKNSVISTLKEALTPSNRFSSAVHESSETTKNRFIRSQSINSDKLRSVTELRRVVNGPVGATTGAIARGIPAASRSSSAAIVGAQSGVSARQPASLRNPVLSLVGGAQDRISSGLKASQRLSGVSGTASVLPAVATQASVSHWPVKSLGAVKPGVGAVSSGSVSGVGRYIHPPHFDDVTRKLSVINSTSSNISALKLVSGGLVGTIPALKVGFDIGGYTGPGGKYEPAGIVHKGEIVWSQADIARHGGVAVVEALRQGMDGYFDGGIVKAMRLGYQGYADGGIVEAPIAPLRRPVLESNGADASGSQNVHVTVGVTVDKNGNIRAFVQDVAQQETKSGISQFARGDLPAHIVKTVKDKQFGGTLK